MPASSSSRKSSSMPREVRPMRCSLSSIPRVPVISNPTRLARRRAFLSSSTTAHESSSPSAMTSLSPLPSAVHFPPGVRSPSRERDVPPSPATSPRYQEYRDAQTTPWIRPLTLPPSRVAEAMACSREDRGRSVSWCRRRPVLRSDQIFPRMHPASMASARGGARLPDPFRRGPDSRSRARYTS
jgi:hypothetical protein